MFQNFISFLDKDIQATWNVNTEPNRCQIFGQASEQVVAHNRVLARISNNLWPRGGGEPTGGGAAGSGGVPTM